jgi:membrane fusion protein (multidrug efflux system)
MSGTTLRVPAGSLPELPVATARAPRVSRRTLAAGALAAALAGAGAVAIAVPKASTSTDDAYLHADSTTIAPKIRGLISAILVHDNEVVRAGDPLVQIDPEEFDARVAAAMAALASARASVQMAQAALVSLDAEERVAQANVLAAATVIRSADAQNDRAVADRHRYESLVGSGAVAKSEVDHFRAEAASAASETAHSRATLAVTREQEAFTRARRAGLLASQAVAEANVAGAQAALDLALQDRGHTLIRSPIDGVVGDRQAQQGDYVQPGTRLLTIVPVRALYVTANFKETQTARMRVGQEAEVDIDALPGTALHGQVESFAPGSGSEFSLLPYEPGTGNFTKIVQRVPVRIRLDAGQADAMRLRPGLSAEVTVMLSGERR